MLNENGELFKQQSNFQDLEELGKGAPRQKSHKKRDDMYEWGDFMARDDAFNDFEVEDEDNELGRKLKNLGKMNVNKYILLILSH